MRFRNPNNGFVEDVTAPGLWCLLFGPFYFAIKGVWSHALISAVVALLTGGLSWLIYPFFASKVIERHYLRNGWRTLDRAGVGLATVDAGGDEASPLPEGTYVVPVRVGKAPTSHRATVLFVLFVASFIGLAFIAGKQPAPSTATQAPTKADQDLEGWRYSNVEWAKQVVAKALRDPDSASFRDVTVVAPKHFDSKVPGTVCGYVNSKNGFGALTGYEPFIVMGGAIPIVDDHSNDFAKLWNKNCANKKML